MSDNQPQTEDFPRWLYDFGLENHPTPTGWEPINRHARNRDAQRKAYFFDPLVEWLGGSLSGKRVLDLGCNAGYWSLKAIEAGCDFVLGIDFHPVNISQALAIFQAAKVDPSRYRFVRGNILEMDLAAFGKFDVVFCLNLLYHVNQPIQLLEKTAMATEDVLVIETVLSPRPGASFDLRREPRESRPSTILAADTDFVLVPTRGALLDTLDRLGFSTVTLKPRFTDYAGAGGYKTGTRRAFISSQRSSLIALPVEVENSGEWADTRRYCGIQARHILGRLRRRILGESAAHQRSARSSAGQPLGGDPSCK